MKIYTKKGDKGQTSLFGGSRVPKNNLRIEAYGTVDELNSHIGLLRDSKVSEEDKKDLIEIQDRLFTLGSILAADPKKSNLQLPPLKSKDVTYLERQMDEMDKLLPEMKTFVLPGGDYTASNCHIARCVCRRAERCVIALTEYEEVDEIILQYLNRLSDYLFVLARKIMLENKGEEVPWIPKM